MSRFAERFREEGREEGRREGFRITGQFREKDLNAGIFYGELTVVRRQLTRRFGALDQATLQRLLQASTMELEQWAENLLDALTLDEVFTHH